MLRRRGLSFVVAIILLISMAAGSGLAFIYENLLVNTAYEIYNNLTEQEEGLIGTVSINSDVPYLNSIEEIVNYDGEFTIRLEDESGFSYTHGTGFLGDKTLYKIKLPSGEMISAHINTESIHFNSGEFSKKDITLPIGRVVYEEIEGYTLEQLESPNSDPLSRTDFYIDMYGNTNMSESYFKQMSTSIVTLVGAAIMFLIIRHIGIYLGIYPAIILTKKQKSRIQNEKEEEQKSDWD